LPARENRCTLPEEITRQEEEETTTKEHKKKQQDETATLPTGEDIGQESTTQTKTTGIAENKRYEKDNSKINLSEDTRSNNGQENGKIDKKQEYERKSKNKYRRRIQGCRQNNNYK
jgi:hypothetical protein